MKKKFYILLLAMVVSFAASAQRFEYQLGLKAGLGVSYLTTNSSAVSDKSSGLSYKFGFTGIYNFGENYGVTTGFNLMGNNLSYKIKVTEVAINEDGEEYTITKYYKRDVKPTYIQIPILLKMRTDTFGGIFRAFGEIGYGFNVLVKKNDKGDENVWQVYEHKNKYRDVCSSFIVHLGMEMAVMDRSTLQVMLAYDNDFSSMMPIGYDKFTWNNFCLEVGFLF